MWKAEPKILQAGWEEAPVPQFQNQLVKFENFMK